MCYLAIRPRLKRVAYEDTEVKLHNEKLRQDAAELDKHYRELIDETFKAQTDLTALNTKLATIQDHEEDRLRLLEEQYSHRQDNLNKLFEEAEEDAQLAYQEILEDLAYMAEKKTEETNLILTDLQFKIQELKSKHDAAVEEYKRAQEMAEKAEFYKLKLSDLDIQEIKKLREVEPYLRDTRPLNKVIWSVYYDHPCTDLIGRVIGAGRHTGIYKLTNTINGMVYVGQAVDIANRWKQHIKCAIGAENAPNNKLYPAMSAVGPEQFTFEIIEECEPEALNEREQYWQDFYKAKEFGYSVR